MSTNKIVSLVLVLLIGLGAIVGVSMYFSYNNTEINLRKQSDAQRSKVEGVYDKMWKIIQQKAQVSNEYKEAFKEIYPEIISGRYSSGDGSLMKWIQESNPEFDTSLYKDLMASIEIYRTEFQHSQEKMIDIIREHEVLISSYPSKWFIKNKQPIEYTVISSTRTKDTVETGIDDNVDLFKK